MDKAYTAEENQAKEEVPDRRLEKDDAADDPTLEKKNQKENKNEDDVSLLKFLEKVDKAAAADGGVDTNVTDTIKNWMKELKN